MQSAKKIIAIADIQANVIALEKLYRYMIDCNINFMINLGDTISIGPYPKETIDILITMEKKGIKIVNLEGNHDEIVRRTLSELQQVYHYTPGILEHEKWTLEQLEIEHNKYLLSFRKEFEGWGCYFSHYARKEDSEFAVFVPQRRYLDPKKEPTYAELDGIYKSLLKKNYNKIFCGHDHFGFDVFSPLSKTQYLNPGSFGVSNFGNAPFYILSISGEEVSVEKKYISYDQKQIVKTLFERDVPEKEFIAKAFFGSKEENA